jgi:serine beta-lactamase-like protein LACTB
MKFITIILLLISSFLNGQDWTEGHTNKAEVLLQEMVDNGAHAGATAGVATDNKIIWIGNHGYADVKSKALHKNSTITRFASIAKTMTAVAILQLVEQGLVDLETPIQTYLPTYPRHAEGDITTKHLLQQTSGIPAYKNSNEIETKKHYSYLEDAINVFKDRNLEHKPGTAYYYTTYGYVVLGRIIEQVSGLSYEAYMQKNIWDKAGMNNTGVEMRNTTYENKSSLYYRKNNGKRKTANSNDLSNRLPGGGLQSTSEDILKFGQAILNNTLITEASFKMMITDPTIRTEGNGYGMGCYLYGNNDEKGFVLGHSGSQTGCSAQLMILPDAKLVSIVLSNTANAWEDTFTLSVKLFKLYGNDLSTID